MTINYTTLLALAEPVTGTQPGVWGDDVNKGITDYLDIAIAGTNTISVDTDVTLNKTQGDNAGSNISAATAQYMQLLFNGARTNIRNVVAPATSKIYVVNNSTTGGFAVVVKTGVSAGVSIANGEKAVIAFNVITLDYVKISSSLISGLTGILPVANGGTGASTLTGVVYGNGTSAMTAASGAQIAAAIGATPVANATNVASLAGGSANQIVYQSGVGVSAFATAPSTAGLVLGWTGTAFNWVSAPAATSASNLAGGGAYTVVYQSSAGTTAYLTNGMSGQVLTATTGGAPTWSSLSSSVTSFETSLSGLTPSTSTTGAVTLAGTLGVSSGGTGLSTLTANNVILGNGTSTPTFVAPSTAGNVLTSNGTTWQSVAAPVTGPTVAKTYYMAQF
jgi:hypothetical protein